MSVAIQVSVTLTEMNCGECGGTYAINERFRRQRQEQSGFWNCPYCKCSWGYAQGELDRVKDELAVERQRKDRALADANELRSKVTKLEKRVKNGVCPCCTRSFQNLRRHIAKKHPEYASLK